MKDFNEDCIAKDIEYYNKVGLKITKDSQDTIEAKAHA
jgi:hypothetical protein